MKQLSVKKTVMIVRLCAAALLLVVASLFLFSFTTHRLTDDFFKQLGISKPDANDKITHSILGGYLDEYGVRNAKNIVLGKRGAVVKDLMIYARQYVNSAAFIKEYNALKESRKPKPNIVKTPEEFRKEMIDQHKKNIAETEAKMKGMDASLKKYMEDAVTNAKKELKGLEDGTTQYYVNYKKNYEQMAKANASANASQLKKWENEFPEDHLLFVKGRLEVFMNETKDIDFSAQLTEKNGKKYFVNKEYEYKGNRWKMAFRAGKDAVETARTMVQQWIDEIK